MYISINLQEVCSTTLGSIPRHDRVADNQTQQTFSPYQPHSVQTPEWQKLKVCIYTCVEWHCTESCLTRSQKDPELHICGHIKVYDTHRCGLSYNWDFQQHPFWLVTHIINGQWEKKSSRYCVFQVSGKNQP